MSWFESITRPAKLWWQITSDSWHGKAPVGAKRSPGWARVQEHFLKAHPACECCGGTKTLRVHHVEPFHLNPARELDPDNLMTLCEAGRYGINCHLLVGHLGNWSRWNPIARLDAKLWAAKLSGWLSAAFSHHEK